MRGYIAQCIVRGDYDEAKRKALELRDLFGEENFYLEIQNHGIPDEERTAAGLIRIHKETGIPLVLTNDAHYINKETPTIRMSSWPSRPARVFPTLPV